MKKRADQLLVDKGLAESLAKAQALVMAGLVLSGTRRVEKPGEMLADEAALSVKGKEHPYVSRGGVKLAAALKHFAINPAGRICLDVGASTGGFTDVLLRSGAEKVYAVDVGTNQLAYSLRENPRVISLEKTNARTIGRAEIPEAPSLIVCDASFISLKQVLPASLSLAVSQAQVVALIKPQFEVERERVGEGGVITDEALQEAVCADIKNWLAEEMHWPVRGIIESPITGAEGNREFLICAERE